MRREKLTERFNPYLTVRYFTGIAPYKFVLYLNWVQVANVTQIIRHRKYRTRIWE